MTSPVHLEALQRQLIERPWDEALREVWADAALEAGLPLGQYAALERSQRAGTETFEQRLAREELFDTHHRDWAAPVLALLPEVSVGEAVAGSPQRLGLDSGYRFGLPGTLGLPDFDPLLVPRLLDAAPTTGLSALIDSKEHLRALAEAGHGGRLTHFAPLLGELLSKEDWRAYADAGGFAQLRSLELSSFPSGLALMLSRAEQLTALALRPSSRGAAGELSALTGAARLSQLESLSLSGRLAADALDGLLARRDLRLRALELSQAQLQSPKLPARLATTLGATLEQLDLSGSQPSLPALAAALPSFQRLRALDVGNPGPGNPQNALAQLLPAVDRTRVRSLRLGAHVLDARTLAALLEPGPWLKLEHLDLTDCRLRPGDALALFQSEAFPALRQLVLAGVPLEASPARALAAAPLLAKLEVLGVSLAPGALEAFAGAVRAPRLRALMVSNVSRVLDQLLGRRPLARLYALEGAPNLREVVFGRAGEGPSLGQLLQGPEPTVTRFRGPATADEVAQFMASPRAAKVRRLELLRVHWSQRAVDAVCDAPQLEKLGYLYASGTWSEEQRSALVRRLGYRVHLAHSPFVSVRG